MANQIGIPDMAHRVFEAAATLEEIGCYVAAGLPNISGRVNGLRRMDNLGLDYGVLHWNRLTNEKASLQIMSDSNYAADIEFNAGNGNAIYGASDTVRPNALMGYWLIRF
jgi:hypothetical protein